MKRFKIARLVSNESLPGKQIGAGGGSLERTATGTLSSMGLAEAFQEIVDSLPDDWTDLEIDLRLVDEERYIDAAVLLDPGQRAALLEGGLALAIAGRPPLRPRRGGRDREGNARPARPEGIEGEMVVREVREGRAEVVQMWGRPESVRREFRRSRSL